MPTRTAPTAHIVAIGDEILNGSTLNSNSTYISSELSLLGVQVIAHSAWPDDLQQIVENLTQLEGSCSIVLLTGGLGPTVDDYTYRAVEAWLGQGHYRDETVVADIGKRYGSDHHSLEKQAILPKGTTPWLNPAGMAPGMWVERKGTLFGFLPGVPPEMRAMMRERVIPALRERHPGEVQRPCAQLHSFGMMESQIDEQLRPLLEAHPEMSVGIYPRQGTITLRLYGDTQVLDAILPQVHQILGDHLFEAPSGTLEEAVGLKLLERGQTVATAESCTAGALASQIVRIPGASRYMQGGVVSYSNQVKSRLLGVDPQVISEHGAVSEAVVQQMAAGVRRQTLADWGLSVSGVAGPDGGSEEKPVGYVWFGIEGPDGQRVAWSQHLRGDRQMIIEKACNALLGRLYQQLCQ